MSKAILIIGESGSGKTTSMRNLPPQQTYYIDADKKGLSWKGWKQSYNEELKNYIKTSDTEMINSILVGINEKRPNIKYIIIDTLNGIMVDDEMKRAKDKGYDKWQDMASSVYDLVNLANNLREDLTVICIAHSQTERDDSGFAFTRMKTSGKKLDKIVVESKFTSVLLAKCVNNQWKFETHANNSTAKTPMGAFSTNEIDNDILTVIKALEEY
jgi:molybdopterin-guanine dinucleotide biosynthesis protein